MTPRRVRSGDPEEIRQELIELLDDFGAHIQTSDLREQVLALVPAVHRLRDLGVSLLLGTDPRSARARILEYFRRYPMRVIAGDELNVVSGISEYARRVRELRVEFGWPIYSGTTVKEMTEEETQEDLFGPDLPLETVRTMKPDDYILMGEQDRDAAFRWRVANEIRRRGDLSVRGRLLEYLRANLGQPVTGEELRYVAQAQSWPRRTRELRTELGWPLVTRSSGRPDLPLGAYLLEADRQAPTHDRDIPDTVRVEVLERDGFQCRCCGWSRQDAAAGDPRSLLELHHITHHVDGGANEVENLVTLCNIHHDEVHRQGIRERESMETWLERSCS